MLLYLTLSLSGCGLRQTAVSHDVAQLALDTALAKQGSPYVYGKRGPHEFDCSGLITWAYRQVIPDLNLKVGYRRVQDAAIDELWRYNVLPVVPSDMAPGDLVFIANSNGIITHGGLFVRWVNEGIFEFINASSYHDAVVLDTWPKDGIKREQYFVGAGRLLVVN